MSVTGPPACHEQQSAPNALTGNGSRYNKRGGKMNCKNAHRFEYAAKWERPVMYIKYLCSLWRKSACFITWLDSVFAFLGPAYPHALLSYITIGLDTFA